MGALDLLYLVICSEAVDITVTCLCANNFLLHSGAADWLNGAALLVRLQIQSAATVYPKINTTATAPEGRAAPHVIWQTASFAQEVAASPSPAVCQCWSLAPSSWRPFCDQQCSRSTWTNHRLLRTACHAWRLRWRDLNWFPLQHSKPLCCLEFWLTARNNSQHDPDECSVWQWFCFRLLSD